MHELRKDPLFTRWVAVLERSKKPGDYDFDPEVGTEGPCMLCAGHESEAPSEVEVVGNAENQGWSVRVVESPERILIPWGDLGRKGVGMYDKMNSVGADEIIIESPEHNKRPEDLGPEHFVKVIETYKKRVVAIKEDSRLRYVLVCMNSGPRAGAQYTHPHSRVVATPVIPFRLKTELDGAKEYYSYKERCLFCDIMDEEMRTGERLVRESEHFVAFCPFAPKFPFEFWVMPKRHECAFKEITPEEVNDLGNLMSSLLMRMRNVLGEPPFSYVIHTAPNMIPRRDQWHTLGDDFHWHIEVMPKLVRTSGVEAGSGFYVVSTSPEDAAGYLREA
jgi:UDPglucose--hexose-1-phosphate uridylyltransferase